MQQLLGIGDVAKLIGIARHRIEYAVSNGSLPEPEIRIANKRAFNINETKNIAQYFGVELTIGEPAEKGEK